MTDRRTLQRLLVALLALSLTVFVAACGDDDDDEGGGTSASTPATTENAQAIQRNAANGKVKLTIGSKNFTEQKLLGEIYAQALGAAGYKVDRKLNLGDQDIALKALKGGDISAYPEYTGTALTAFFDVASDKIPKDPDVAFDQTRDGFAKDDLVALPPTPFTSSNEVAVTKATADKLGLKTISDLSDHAKDLTLYGTPECRTRLDCLKGLEDVYGLDFKAFKPVAIDLRHEVLSSGQADVSIVFTTDPQIKREGFVLLEDDRGMFPPYNSTLVVRKQVAEAAGPDMQKTVELVNQGLTEEALQELNARVDLDKQSPRQVARAYLEESGYIGT